MDSPRSSEESLTHRRGDLHRRSLEETHPNDDEDYAGGEDDGIQLGLLSRKSRLGKERQVLGLDGDGLTTRQLVMGILAETVPTLMSTVIGMVFTGELLERISTWRALRQLDELFILIPMLNNMKGNLEMNLSARLSTEANTGNLDDVLSRRTQLSGTLSLLQVQAIALSTLAALASFSLGKLLPPAPEDPSSASRRPRRRWSRYPRISLVRHESPAPRGATRPSKIPQYKAKTGFREFLAVIAIAMSSASLSALILGSFMCSIILLCRRYRLNPDNISTPLAACLGDLLTLTLVAFSATFLTYPTLSVLRLPLITGLLFTAVLCTAAYYTLRNPIARPLLKDGLSWVPLLCAMAISSGTGLVLDKFVTRWKDFGSLAVVISGLPASVGAVFVSRLSTDLHAHEHHPASRSSEGSGGVENSMLTGATLFSVGLPVLFMYLIFMYSTGWLELPFIFLVMFVLAFGLTSAISLLLAKWLTHKLWQRGYDPDTYCLPVHSSIMELVGQCLLVGAYASASMLGVDVRISSE